MELPWVPGPVCPHPEAEGQARAAQCPACSLPGVGTGAPSRAGAGPAFARSWGDGGDAGGKACVLPSHLLPHQMLLPGTGMCSLRMCSNMPWDGEHCCSCHHCPQHQEWLRLPLLHPQHSPPWSSPPIFPFASCLPPTPPSLWEDEEEQEEMVNNKEPFCGGFIYPGWEKPWCWCPILQLTASTSVWSLW